MSTPKNIDQLIGLSKAKTEKCRAKVATCIDQLLADGENVSFYKVHLITGVSKSFLYSDEKSRELVENARSENKVSGDEGEDARYRAMRRRNSDLSKSIKEKDDKIAELERKLSALESKTKK